MEHKSKLNGTIIWQPSDSQIENSAMFVLAEKAEKETGISLKSFEEILNWSVSDLEGFWSLVWDDLEIVGEKGARATSEKMPMPGAKFFPESKLNFAENLLQKRGSSDALVFNAEGKFNQKMSWDELHSKVSQLQQYFQSIGIKAGDRIAAMLPNMPEAIIGALAASSIGAVWASCSPDFGEKGVLDRFGQIEPKVLMVSDGYWYNGKEQDISGKVSAIVDNLPTLKAVLVVDLLGKAKDLAGSVNTGAQYSKALSIFEPKEVNYTRFAFDHPLYILFSSGTTGIPKCIVHSQGGILLQQKKEHKYHSEIGEGDRVFYFTTCGWMMWNWLVAGLSSNATLLLYDGSPFYPDGNVLFDFAEKEKCTLFGTSAKFIDALRKAELRPINTHDLSSIKIITSTGSPLAPENFAYVGEAISKEAQLASMSGGTDIAGCFVGGVPILPVRIGEIQGSILGMNVQVWEDENKPIQTGKGELVCATAFPSMPICFWNDPDGKKYHSAYFDRFDGVWCHGDFAEWTENGGMIIHGRSDATLNPGGVRIGTAEIYNHVEQLPEILEAICIGQEWDNDVRVILFVRLSDGVVLDKTLATTIKKKIRSGASPRHVPAKILAVKDIPRTKSGKITELAVGEVVHGRPVKNQEALANPEALELFINLAELQT